MGALVDAALARRSRAEVVIDLWCGVRNVAEGLSIAVEGTLEGRETLTDDQLRTLRGALAAWVVEIDRHLGVPT